MVYGKNIDIENDGDIENKSKNEDGVGPEDALLHGVLLSWPSVSVAAQPSPAQAKPQRDADVSKR